MVNAAERDQQRMQPLGIREHRQEKRATPSLAPPFLMS
jgi:hypothetical protein